LEASLYNPVSDLSGKNIAGHTGSFAQKPLSTPSTHSEPENRLSQHGWQRMSSVYEPYEILGYDRPSDIVLLCDHATNTVPPDVARGCLGLPEADMQRHIAYDVGAAGLTWLLSERLRAPAILSNFSRLVIDPNRGEDDPTLVMQIYDGSVIPGNRGLDDAEVDRRLNAYHRPYHQATKSLVESRSRPVPVSIHSFTPRLRGRPPRPWHIGVLYAHDRRLADPLMFRLRRERNICVGDNQPYTGSLTGDTMDRHALNNGHHHILLEIRSDLIETFETQKYWAARLTPILQEAITAAQTT
jgi:predicted N-formylglutamate amidohydrolase